jgi:Ca2+/Na+ antiporter
MNDSPPHPNSSPEIAAVYAQESNAAALVGGIIGSILFLAVIAVVVLLIKNKSFRARRSRSRPAELRCTKQRL